MAANSDSTQVVSPKVKLPVAASAAVTVLAYLTALIFGVDVPELVQGAVATVLVFVAGYSAKDPLRVEHDVKREIIG